MWRDDAAAAPRRASATSSSPRSRRRSTAARRSSRCRSRRSASWSHELGFKAERVHVVAAGYRPAFTPGGEKSPTPLVVAVGRLVPVKRFDLLIDALVALQGRASRAAGGDRRRGLRARRRSRRRSAPRGAETWITLPGRVDDDELRRPLPPRVGRRQHVGARGLGHDDHRGRRVRHAGGRHPHRRPRRRGDRRRERACSPTTAPSDSPPGSTVLADDALRGRLARRRARHAAAFTWERDGTRHPRGARAEAAIQRRTDRVTSTLTERAPRAEPDGVAGISAPAGSASPRLHRARRSSRTSRSLLTAPGQGRRRHEELPLPRSGPAARRGRASMWDPNIGLGTVTHQNIGYLFPMGPYYWLMQALGVPDWVRSGSGSASILFFAGARRPLPAAHARRAGPRRRRRARSSYMFTPVLARLRGADLGDPALPWAALPWMIALDDPRRCATTAAGAIPALFALVVQLVGGVNATALDLRRHRAGAVDRCTRGWSPARSRGGARSASPSRRSACSRSSTSLWWMAGLSVAGQLRARHPQVHRDGQDGVAARRRRRGAARARLLVLLRPATGSARGSRPSIRLHAAPRG